MVDFNNIQNTRYGMMIYNRFDNTIGKSIELYGEWAQAEMELLCNFISTGMTVLDVGANIGTHTMAFSKMVGDRGRVYSFEPQRFVYYTLAGNVTLNSLTNVWCLHSAVSDVAGEVFVPLLDMREEQNIGGTEIGNHLMSNVPGEFVPVTRLDDLQLTKCHLIKIDVEGMEQHVLQGATRLISEFHPVLYMENNRLDRSASLISYVQGLGYDLYWHTPYYYNPNNFTGNQLNVFGSNQDFNMLCVPKGISLPVVGLSKI